MSIITELDTLKTNLLGAKTKLSVNLTAKGVTSNENDTLNSMADKVAEIPTGGGFSMDLTLFGYSESTISSIDTMTKYQNDVDMAYSKILYDKYKDKPDGTEIFDYQDSEFTNGNVNLVCFPYLPNIAFKAYDNGDMFCNMQRLKYFGGCSSISTGNRKKFLNCPVLEYVAIVSIYNGDFRNCRQLRIITTLNNLASLTHYYPLADDGETSYEQSLNNCEKLCYLKGRNIGDLRDGYAYRDYTYDFSKLKDLGDDNIVPGARAAMVYTFVENLCERSGEGYENAIYFKFNKAVENRFTAEEKAAIKVKGNYYFKFV